MAEFNAMDTAAFKGVWVFCEQREGEIQSISYQLLSEGRKLANDLGVELAGVVMGSGLAEADLKTLGGYGADRVYNIDSPLLKDYTTDGYAKALCDLIMDKKPEIMLIGATNLGRRPRPPLRSPSAHRSDRRLHPSGRRCREVQELPAHHLQH